MFGMRVRHPFGKIAIRALRSGWSAEVWLRVCDGIRSQRISFKQVKATGFIDSYDEAFKSPDVSKTIEDLSCSVSV